MTRNEKKIVCEIFSIFLVSIIYTKHSVPFSAVGRRSKFSPPVVQLSPHQKASAALIMIHNPIFLIPSIPVVADETERMK